MSFASSSSKPPRSEEKDRGRLRSFFSFPSMFEMISSNKKYSFYVLSSSLSYCSYCNVCIDVKSNKTAEKRRTKKRYLSSSVLFVRE